MREIELKTLRLFAAVCEHNNMARAAEQEHIEPSAVSKRMARLEADLGTPLFMRSRRGVQPTAAGVAVLEHAHRVLFTMNQIAQEAATFGAGVTGHVRMVATASAIAESLLDDVAAFMREPVNRNIRVDIEERVSDDLVRHVRDGMASVGVCWDSVARDDLQSRPYRQDRLALAVHPRHALARRKSLRFEQTLAFGHVGLQPNTAVHRMLQRAAARIGRAVSYRAVVSNFDAAFRFVAADLAVSVVPMEVGGPYATMLGVRLVPLTDAWTRRSFVICFRDFESLRPPARRMVEHLAQRAAAAAAPS